jgi:predicted  nucleic acid-binding Zn-ribbon protein
MNNKLTKLQMEIDKIKQKISEQQTKLRELEHQKTEIENTEIVELVRSMKMNTSELSTFLKAYRGKNDAPILISETQEDNDHE